MCTSIKPPCSWRKIKEMLCSNRTAGCLVRGVERAFRGEQSHNAKKGRVSNTDTGTDGERRREIRQISACAEGTSERRGIRMANRMIPLGHTVQRDRTDKTPKGTEPSDAHANEYTVTRLS